MICPTCQGQTRSVARCVECDGSYGECCDVDGYLCPSCRDDAGAYCDHCGQRGCPECNPHDDPDDCVECGVCNDCTERTRAYYEAHSELVAAGLAVLERGQPGVRCVWRATEPGLRLS